jgi:flagellar hook assembly protein FlgD
VSVEFEVRGTFGFEWAINYPNPFSHTTTIAYVLTDASDDFVEAKVYTVSGRRVRTFRESLRSVANYREMVWDGRDDTGQDLANGVYFVKLTAKQGGRKVEKIIKLAKAR